MKKSSLITSFVLSSLLIPSLAIAAEGDLSIDPNSIRFSTNNFVEGQKIRIYATSTNTTDKDLYGVIKFFDTDGKKQIGTDQPISIFAGKTDDVFVDWIAEAGTTKLSVELVPFEQAGDVKTNNYAARSVFVEADFDRDGTPDAVDQDDDNDKVNDIDDAFPRNKNENKDTDGDGIGDGEDNDDDNDGYMDTEDALPLDSTENLDSDKDGIGDKKDPDDDNDGLYDGEEIAKGTSPNNPDTDKDNVVDGKDAFPTNPGEQLDTNKNGIGNNADSDDDGDGVEDKKDPFPTNLPPLIEQKGVSFITAPNKEITYDASISTDPDGKIKKVVWKIDNEKEQEGIIVHHTFKDTGKHKIALSVTDDAGETVDESYTVYVTKSGRILLGSLLLALLALAIYFGVKYSAHAPLKRSSKKSKK